MKKLILTLPFIIAVAVGGIFAEGLYQKARADGAATVQLDAGIASASGSTASSASSAPKSTAPTPPDVAQHPAEAYDYEAAMYKQGGILLAIVAGLYMVAAFLGRWAASAKPTGWLAFFDKGKLPVIYAALASSLAAVLAALTHVTGWPAALAAIAAAGATVLHPNPGPAK